MICLFAEPQALSVKQICSLIKNRRINVPLHQIPEATSAATTAHIAYYLIRIIWMKEAQMNERVMKHSINLMLRSF